MALKQVDLSLPMAQNTVLFLQPDRPGLERFARDLAEQYRQGQLAIVVDEKCRAYFSADFLDNIQRFHFVIRSEAGKRQAFFRHGDRALENGNRQPAFDLAGQGLRHVKGQPGRYAGPGDFRRPVPWATKSIYCPEPWGKAALIATAPVLRLLTSYDVRPDLVGILDYSPDNYTVLRDVYGTEDVPLVFLEGTYPRVIREYQGELISVLHTHGPVRKWLAPFLAQREHLPAGTNVGSFCLQLAIYLGADPIILVGQDLAFPEQTTHSEGVVGCRSVNFQADSPDHIRLDSVAGGQVLSTITLATYLEEFNQIIKLNPRTYVNTAPKGARINGTLEMPLEEAIERYCRQNRNIAGVFREAPTFGTTTMSEVARELGSLEKEMVNLKVVVEKALIFSHDIRSLLDRDISPQDHELLNLINVHAQYTSGAVKYVRAIGPLRQYLAEPLSKMKTRELHFTPDLDWRETIREYLDDKETMMAAVSKGTSRLSEVVGRSRSELEEVVDIMEGRLSDSSARTLNRAALIWTRLGRLNQAWTCRRQALAARPDSVKTVLEAARLCLQRERPRQAVEMLRHFSPGQAEPVELTGLINEAESAAQTWLASAESLLNNNDWVSALINVRKYLAYEPADPKARKIEALCLEKRGQRIRDGQANLKPDNDGFREADPTVRTDLSCGPGDRAQVAPPLADHSDGNEGPLLPGPKECRWP